MAQYSVFNKGKLVASIGHDSCELLGAAQGCKGDCAAGISVYYGTEYQSETALHPFQEGFYVLRGFGSALVGGEEIPLSPGTAFLVPKQTPHTIRRSGEDAVEVFWFHST